MKAQYVAEDGKVFDDKLDCEWYEQEQLGIDHGFLQIDPRDLHDPYDE